MWWTYITALTSVLIGFGFGWRSIKRGRLPTACDDTLLHWSERPFSVWHQDWIVALFITLHGLTVIILTVLFLLHTIRSAGHHTLFLLDTARLLTYDIHRELSQELSVLVTLALGFVAFLCGTIPAFPIATRLIRPTSVTIASSGPVCGQYTWSWASFSHFSADPRARFIRFYPIETPGIASMAWQPPDEDTYTQAVALIGQCLPHSPPCTATPWYRRRTVFLGLLFAITVPFIVGGLLLYAFRLSWAWMYYTFITYVVFALGGAVLRSYQV
jgi:hypothetical protein